MGQNEDRILKQYMVEFTIPQPIPDSLLLMIPDQRREVDRLFQNGKMVSYSLSMDRNTLWAIFLASSESELLSLIDQLPLSIYFEYNYNELMFHQSMRLLPAMSLN